MSGSGLFPPPAAVESATSSPPSDAASNDYDFDLSILTRQPSFTEKLWEKTKKDPLVPIGQRSGDGDMQQQQHCSRTARSLLCCAVLAGLSATVFALSGGLMSMVNSSRNSNKCQ
jgi:hypothetical protein